MFKYRVRRYFFYDAIGISKEQKKIYELKTKLKIIDKKKLNLKKKTYD